MAMSGVQMLISAEKICFVTHVIYSKLRKSSKNNCQKVCKRGETVVTLHPQNGSEASSQECMAEVRGAGENIDIMPSRQSSEKLF